MIWNIKNRWLRALVTVLSVIAVASLFVLLTVPWLIWSAALGLARGVYILGVVARDTVADNRSSVWKALTGRNP